MFWHGLNPFGALQLNEAGPAWAERGFRVLAPTAPGFGESPPFPDLEDYRPTRLAELVVELADATGLGRFAYVGWSWGATIGVHLGARHAPRLSGLALLDAGHTDVQDVGSWAEMPLDERIAEFEAGVPRFASWEELLALARERATAWRPALEQRIRAGMTERDGSIVARGDLAAAGAALHWTGVERPSEQLSRLGELDLPVLLVVASRNDTAAQLARFRHAVPHTQVLEVDSEHDVLAHAPQETISLVADWLLDAAQPRVA